MGHERQPAPLPSYLGALSVAASSRLGKQERRLSHQLCCCGPNLRRTTLNPGVDRKGWGVESLYCSPAYTVCVL